MAGQFRFKNNSGTVVAQISASNAGAMSFSGSALDFSSVTTLTLGTTTLSGTASFATTAVSSSYGLNALTGSNAMTASSADTLYVRNNATVLGSITAQTLVVQTITSSVLFTTGSNKIGSSLSNVQELTGSVGITGSLAINGTTAVVGSGTANYVPKFTASGTIGNSAITDDGTTVTLVSRALSGTSATFSGNITSTITANEFFQNVSGGTNRIYAHLANTGADLYLSIAGSAANSPHTGQLSYASALGTGNATALQFATTDTIRMTITSAGNFDYGNINISAASPSTTYKQAFYGGLSLMWRGGEDAYLNSNHTYTTTNTNIASYNGSNGIGRITISGGNFEWGTYNGSVTSGTAYSLTSRFLISPAGNVGIGTTSPLNALDVRQANATMGNYQTIQAFSTNSAGINLGGGISLGGFYTGTSDIAQFASIVGRKENATSGNYDGYLAFGTNAQATGVVERMRITSGGQVLIGRTSASIMSVSGLAVDNNIVSCEGAAGLFTQNRASTNFFGFYGSTNLIVYNSNVGTIGSFNATSGAYAGVSDINKKKDFEQSQIGLNEVLGLKPTFYRMKTEDGTQDKHLGFIAQEVKEFIPQAYSETGEGDDKFIGLTEMPIIAALTKAIQELSAKVTLLENK